MPGLTELPEFIDTPAKLATLCQELAATDAATEPLAIDTEFIRESTFFPIVALIQIATRKKTWLVDPIALKKEALQPLFTLLRDPIRLKILHAAQADQECFYTAYGFTLPNSFDTAVGASLCGYGESIGLAKLMREELGVRLEKGHARTDWTVRPLPSQMAEYAASDVRQLVELSDRLIAKLDKKGRRAWAIELSAKFEDPKLYEPNPKALAIRLITKVVRSGTVDPVAYSVLTELLAWRENRARSLDVPRRRVMDDDVIADLAKVRPKTREHLDAFRGINRGELKVSGDALVRAIQKGLDNKLTAADLPNLKLEVEDEEVFALALLDLVLKVEAKRLDLAPRHLATNEGLLQLLRGRFSSVEEIVEKGILSKSAADFVGQELLNLMAGKTKLKLEKGRVEVLP